MRPACVRNYVADVYIVYNALVAVENVLAVFISRVGSTFKVLVLVLLAVCRDVK